MSASREFLGRILEKHFLGSRREGEVVVAEVAEEVDEFDGAVRAVDFAGRDTFDGFQELIKVGVVGEWEGVVDLPAVLGPRVDGPAGGGNGDGAAEAGEAEGAHAAGESEEGEGKKAVNFPR